jgi:hypothetical protein
MRLVNTTRRVTGHAGSCMCAAWRLGESEGATGRPSDMAVSRLEEHGGPMDDGHG